MLTIVGFHPQTRIKRWNYKANRQFHVKAQVRLFFVDKVKTKMERWIGMERRIRKIFTFETR